MDTNTPVEILSKPKYTIQWLIRHTLFVLGITLLLSIIVSNIDSYAWRRMSAGLLNNTSYSKFSELSFYSFPLISITTLTLVLMEIAFRKSVNYLQYGLIALALTLFFLLLLAMAEKMPFGLAYFIVSAMTTGLIGLFVKGLMHSIKAATLITSTLIAEIVTLFILIQLGAMSLLVSSLLLFVLLTVTMFFTLKLKVENKEMYLKL